MSPTLGRTDSCQTRMGPDPGDSRNEFFSVNDAFQGFRSAQKRSQIMLRSPLLGIRPANPGVSTPLDVQPILAASVR